MRQREFTPASRSRRSRSRTAVVVLAAAGVATGSVLATGGAAEARIDPATANSGTLTLSNLDGIPNWGMPTTMVFNRIQSPADANQAVHDTGTIRLTNSGSQAFSVSALTITGPFKLNTSVKLPFTIAAGSHADLSVKFTAESGGSRGSEEPGTFTITTTAGSGGTQTVRLDGWWQNLSEHTLEPFVPNIKNMFGLHVTLPTNMDGIGEVKKFSSDEVLSPYFHALDSKKPVTVNEIAGFHTYPQSNTLTYFYRGHSSTQHAFSSAGQYQAQSVLPRKSSLSTLPAAGSFTALGYFGLKVDNEYSDPTMNDQTVDRSKGCNTTQCGNHVRVFQLHNVSGSIRTGQYLVVEDAGGVNYDYNDNVYLLNNVTTASAS